MEQNKRHLLRVTNKVQPVGLHNQSGSGTSLGTPKRTRQKGSPDSPSLLSQVGRLRPGRWRDWPRTSKPEAAHLRTDRSTEKKKKKESMNSANLKCQGDNVEVEKSFFFCFLIIKMVDSNQFPLFQLPDTPHTDHLKPQLTRRRSVSALKRTTPSRAESARRGYFLSQEYKNRFVFPRSLPG